MSYVVRCILLKFYIKPQQRSDCLICFEVVSYWNSTSNHNEILSEEKRFRVVSYWNSTSNHNDGLNGCEFGVLYLIEILHQTTTMGGTASSRSTLYLIEILHQTTTDRYVNPPVELLYLIEILHQTTTSRPPILISRRLYLIEILHQTTTREWPERLIYGCILLKFYIKPQLA